MPDESKPSYYKEAFNEPANLFTMAGLLGLSAITFNPLPLLLGAGAEALYMLFVPDSAAYKRYADLRRMKEAKANVAQRRESTLAKLWPALADRYRLLERLGEEIRNVVRGGGSEMAMLFAQELDKLDTLLESFVHLAEAYVNYKQYLDKVDDRKLEAERSRLDRKIQQTRDPGTTGILRQNLDIIEKRLQRFDTVRNQITRVQAQMEVIENTFHLLREQIMTIDKPEDLTIDLGSLLNSVELTERSVAETSPYLAELKQMELS